MEFALVLPMLLVLLLGVIDFGRVFHAGVTVEAASRAAAEVVAQEYLQLWRNGAPIDYAALNRMASKVACEELQDLPNTTFVPDASGPGGTCPGMPVIRVCVHDNEALNVGQCGAPVGGFATSIPDACTTLQGDSSPSEFEDPPWNAGLMGDGGASRYVEVRVCYEFSTLFDLRIAMPMNTGLNLGTVWLQQRAVFTVAEY